jgi:agmatinase
MHRDLAGVVAYCDRAAVLEVPIYGILLRQAMRSVGMKTTVSHTRPVRVGLLGLPTDVNSSHIRGAAEAPKFIREAIFSPSSNMWSETLVDLEVPGTLNDEGDVALQEDAGDCDRITAAVERVMAKGLTPLSFGGDHSVTYPILRAVAKHHRKLSILHFDAHPDLYDIFAGNRLSHACPFARIMEEGLAQKLVQVGIRTLNGHQQAQAKKFGVTIVEMDDFDAKRVPVPSGPLYVTIDLDGLDPAFAPGVAHPEGGGLSVRDVIRVLHRIKGPIVGADVVELLPSADQGGRTAVAAAKFAKELAGLMVKRHGATRGDARGARRRRS